MKIKCEYCGNNIDDADDVCPQCGAPNNGVQRSGSGVPKTLEELKEFCRRRNLPLEDMRFFIGEDYTEPRAFGIFRDDDGQFVVYKNKSDGSRAVRYRGNDEAYAVNEIYQKLRSEYANHKSANTGRMRAPSQAEMAQRQAYQARLQQRKKANNLGRIILIAVLVFIVGCMIYAVAVSDRDGYYKYRGTHYYLQGTSWYEYDDYDNEWIPSSKPTDDVSDYYESSSYDSDYEISDFSDSEYYREPSYSSDSSSSSSWDDDDDWDSWDSGSDWDWDSGSDWDSDW